MQKKDQELLAKAYEQILSEKLNWKGALAAGLMGATAMGAVSCNRDQLPQNTNNFVQQRIEAIQKNMPETKGEYYKGGIEIHDYLEILSDLSQDEINKINSIARTLGPDKAEAWLINIAKQKHNEQQSPQQSSQSTIKKGTYIGSDWE